MDVRYLSMDVRSKLMNSMLFPQFTIDGEDGHATLSVKGNELVTLHRPERAVFRQQLAMVRAYSDLRGDRTNEILIQTGDLFSFYGALGYLSANRHRKTLTALYTCQRVAVHVEMPIKHFCRSPRPIDYSTHVQPMIQTPDHSAYPSGHAIEVFAASTVMARLLTGMGPKEALGADPNDNRGRMAGMTYRLAHRIATNRSVAGVHFPIDSASGAVIGCMLGDALYRVATGATDWPDLKNISFEPIPDSDPPFDLTLRWLREQLPEDAAGGSVPDQTTIFGKLWKEAAEEWQEAAL